MATYTLTHEWDVCRAPDAWQDAPLRWLLHTAFGCRWPDFQGWQLTDDTGYIIAVTVDLYADSESCQEAQAWAGVELRIHTEEAPGTWTDVSVFEETIQFTTAGVPYPA